MSRKRLDGEQILHVLIHIRTHCDINHSGADPMGRNPNELNRWKLQNGIIDSQRRHKQNCAYDDTLVAAWKCIVRNDSRTESVSNLVLLYGKALGYSSVDRCSHMSEM